MKNDSKVKEKAKSKPKAKGKGFKWGRWFLLICAVVLLLSAVAVWFSFEPQRSQENVKLTAEDFSRQSQVMQQIMGLIFRKQVPEISVLKVTPDQLNSMLKAGSLFQTKNFSLQAYNLHVCPDGVLKFRYGHDTKMRWLHGGILPVYGKVKFSKKGNVLDARFQSLGVGLLPLPESAGKLAFDRFLSRQGSTQGFRLFMECVQSLNFDAEHGYFLIIVRTKQLRQIL